MRRYIYGARAGVGRLLGADKQVRHLQEELAEERRRVERLEEQNRHLKRRARGSFRGVGEGEAVCGLGTYASAT